MPTRPPTRQRDYMGSRLDVAEALRHADEIRIIADRIARRGRAETTQEFPVDTVDAAREKETQT